MSGFICHQEHRAVLTALVNDLANPPQPIILVLDDYHLITEQAAHDVLTALVEQTPPLLQLVLISRHDPPLPLARWRVRDLLAELRSDELRFRTDEAARYLGAVASATMPLEMVEQLVQPHHATPERHGDLRRPPATRRERANPPLQWV